MADVWSIKRAMEKKYGAILETHFFKVRLTLVFCPFSCFLNVNTHPKDFEVPDRYQMMAFVIFRDLAALERIPEAGEEFTVLAPELNNKPIYNIGLKEIEPFAGMDDIQPGFEFDKVEPDSTRRVIGGRIRRSRMSSFQSQKNPQKLTYLLEFYSDLT